MITLPVTPVFRFLPAAAFAAAFLLISGASSAAVIASYDFDDDATGLQDLTNAANLTAGDVGVGAGLASGSGGAGLSASRNNLFATSNRVTGSNQTAGTVSAAVADDDYFGFTLTPDVGYQLNLESFSFNIGFNSFNQPNGASFFVVRTSADGFANNASIVYSYDEAVDPVLDNANSGRIAPKVIVPVVDLSSLTGLTGAIEIRVYVFDSGPSSGSSTPSLRLDDFVVNGEAVLIPEPAAVMLMSLGGVLILSRRRRS